MTRRAVIFDFDGTITRPYLDFAQIREEMGVKEGPILEALAAWPESERQEGLSILERYEHEAARNATLQEGAVETLERLKQSGFLLAILTRNARPFVEMVCEKFNIAVDELRSREDGAIKPSAEPVLALCEKLDTQPANTWMVGDHLFDIISGSTAGARTVLMAGGPDHGEDIMNEARQLADRVVDRLPELIDIVIPE